MHFTDVHGGDPFPGSVRWPVSAHEYPREFQLMAPHTFPGTRIPRPRRRRSIPALVASALLAATALVGCGSDQEAGQSADSDTATTDSTAEGFPVTVTVTPNDQVVIEDRPERIVSLSPTSTEMLFAIGSGDQVVAADEYSNYPEEAPRVDGLSGYTPNVEAVLEYDPDLVVLTPTGEGIVDGLTAAGVPTIMLDASEVLEDTYEQIELLGEATGHRDNATELVDDMQTTIDETLATVPQDVKDAGLTYYHELSSSYHSISDRTYLGQIYAAFGLSSIAPDTDDYPQLTSEAVVAANPDIIFLANTKAEGMDPETVAARPGWETIDAVRDDQVISLDDDLASRWGPRVDELVEEIARQLNEQVVPTMENAAAPAAA